MSMESMMKKAATLAGDAAAEGKCVMVLFPCTLWCYKAHQYLDGLGGAENGVFIRYSNLLGGLKTLAPDVLILVAVGEPEWVKYGLDSALDKLQAQRGKVHLLYLEDGE
jgi:hypothetical protein